jgi:hypothetical protein
VETTKKWTRCSIHLNSRYCNLHVDWGYILWRVCEFAAGMIKFELFGPKVYYFGPLWAFGATLGGRGWEAATPNTKFSTTPSPQMSSKSLVSVAVWGESGDALRNPGAPPQRTPTAAGGTEGPPATIGFWCRSVCSSRVT